MTQLDKNAVIGQPALTCNCTCQIAGAHDPDCAVYGPPQEPPNAIASLEDLAREWTEKSQALDAAAEYVAAEEPDAPGAGLKHARSIAYDECAQALRRVAATIDGERRLLRGRLAYLEADRQVVEAAVDRERERCAQSAERWAADLEAMGDEAGTECATLRSFADRLRREAR